MSVSFEQNIQQWVQLDNNLRVVYEKAKEIRDKKNIILQPILQHIQTNQLEKTTIQISDGRLRFAETKVTQPLTLKYLEKCLHEIIRNEQQVNAIMNHIKKKRESKTVADLKRY